MHCPLCSSQQSISGICIPMVQTERWTLAEGKGCGHAQSPGPWLGGSGVETTHLELQRINMYFARPLVAAVEKESPFFFFERLLNQKEKSSYI